MDDRYLLRGGLWDMSEFCPTCGYDGFWCEEAVAELHSELSEHKTTAKDMFENLGYKFIKSEQTLYYVDDGEGNEFEHHPSELAMYRQKIEFDLKGKMIDGADYICISALKAINEQCRELGWLE